MCGIAGFITPRSMDDAGALDVLRRMTDVIAYRGPDDSGHFTAGSEAGERIGLGHRRLSIIDLGTGQQPMYWGDGRFVIVFNGEIYNYQALKADLAARGAKFATDSDTEVILAAYEAYGDECVRHLRGMFAFALWDRQAARLLIARDPFGKKPLYFTQDATGLIFGSEIKCLRQWPWHQSEVDVSAIWDYFAYRYVPGPRTLFSNVEKLPPGSLLVWEKGKATISRYFTPPDAERLPQTQLDDAEAIRRIGAVLEESVRIRLVSDVPFGAFLSGGIDSSVIVGLMARHLSEPVKTFSVGFAEEQYSEQKYSSLVASHFKTSHHELVVKSDDLIEHLPHLVRLRDAPVAEPSDIPIYLLSVEARRHVKMVLTGEGSDELFGGYPKHVVERYAAWFGRIPAFLRDGLMLPLVNALPYSQRRIKTAINALSIPGWPERMARWFGALSETERRALLQIDGPGLNEASLVRPVPAETNSPLKRILAFDQLSWLPDHLLERGDRMTMGASLEARMPFMDQVLAKEAAMLPDRMRVRHRETKWVIRQYAQTLVPDVIIRRPKVGFRVPVNVWFQTSMRDYIRDMLLGADSATAQYFRRPALERVLGEHIDGRSNHEKLIWTMLNLELWHREYA